MDTHIQPINEFHLGQIDQWCQSRGLPALSTQSLPPTGYVYDNTACLFLIKTDAQYSLIDFVVTNPDKSSLERHIALKTLVNQALSDAFAQDNNYVLSTTIEADIAKRSAIHNKKVRYLGQFYTFSLSKEDYNGSSAQ